MRSIAPDNNIRGIIEHKNYKCTLGTRFSRQKVSFKYAIRNSEKWTPHRIIASQQNGNKWYNTTLSVKLLL